MSTKSSILLAYRRADDPDTIHMIERIANQLGKRYGTDAIVDGSTVAQPGTDTEASIEAVMPRQSAVVVPIGPRWVEGPGAPGGPGPLDYPYDLVRLEIEAALRHHVPLIPVLVGKNPRPPGMPLPPSIAPLLMYPNMVIREDPDFTADMGNLIGVVDRWVRPRPVAAGRFARGYGLIIGFALLPGEFVLFLLITLLINFEGSGQQSNNVVVLAGGPLAALLAILGAYFLAGMLAARRTGLAGTGSGAGLIASAVNGAIGALCAGGFSLQQALSYKPNPHPVGLDLSGFSIFFAVLLAIAGLLWLVLNLGLGAGFGAIGGLVGRRGYRGPMPDHTLASALARGQ